MCGAGAAGLKKRFPSSQSAKKFLEEGVMLPESWAAVQREWDG